MEDTAGRNRVFLIGVVFRVNCPGRFGGCLAAVQRGSDRVWVPTWTKPSAQFRIPAKWPLRRRYAELLHIGGFNINLENLNISSQWKYIHWFCNSPLGWWIQPRATWNCNNVTLRTCERRKLRLLDMRHEILSVWFFMSIYSKFNSTIRKANVFPSTSLSSFSLCHSVLYSQWFLLVRSQASQVTVVTLVSLVTASYPPSAGEVDIV